MISAPFSRTCGLLATATLLLTTLPAGAQTVNNPGFEDPGTTLAPGYAQYFTGQTIGTGGWTVGGSDVFVLNSAYTETSGNVALTFNAFDGSNALDITGSGNTGANTITQTLAFQPGQFTLSFYLGRINDTGAANPVYTGNASVSVSLGGLALGAGTFTNTTESVGSVNYALFNVPFTVNAAGNYDLTFTNATPTGNNYAGLDNITVNVVPEPSTYAMVIGTLGLLAIGRRLRRQRGMA